MAALKEMKAKEEENPTFKNVVKKTVIKEGVDYDLEIFSDNERVLYVYVRQGMVYGAHLGNLCDCNPDRSFVRIDEMSTRTYYTTAKNNGRQPKTMVLKTPDRYFTLYLHFGFGDFFRGGEVVYDDLDKKYVVFDFNINRD